MAQINSKVDSGYLKSFGTSRKGHRMTLWRLIRASHGEQHSQVSRVGGAVGPPALDHGLLTKAIIFGVASEVWEDEGSRTALSLVSMIFVQIRQFDPFVQI
ncbi:hypothetical protein HPP92_020576 [Vanilla planifolia]|uniref:Uncharacterized protein n=1 Tax=Vanilla planifolia TaxID=51239 RepID=A0A835UIL2_VANPL|nr:hypothetical protein HPP92_020576 [Vanilla planifolia]